MAMFDDTNFEDELAGLDDLLKDYEPTDMDELHQEKPKHKAEVEFKRPAPHKQQFADEMSDMLLDEDEDEFEDDEEEQFSAPKPQKEKGVGGLIALCVAETVAIIGLLAWWFLCLR